MTADMMAVLDATWAPASVTRVGGWTIRNGAGGGKRVSAATGSGDVAEAEAAMRALGEAPLFRLTPGDPLDAVLAARGYRLVHPSLILTAPAQALAGADPKGFTAIRCEAPLALMEAIWAQGGIGPARLAVMARSGSARIYLLGRHNDRAAACAFAALSGDVAMLHALEVAPWARRSGMGRALTGAAAAWALEQGAGTLALAVTEANAAARALYAAMGMRETARYHYRALPEETP